VDKLDKEILVKTIGKGGILSFLGNIFRLTFEFLFHIILGHFLGVALYGIFFLGLSFLNLIRQFTVLGFDQALIRYISLYEGVNKRGNTRGVMILAFVFSLSLGVIAGILIYIFAPKISTNIFHKPNLEIVLKVFGFCLPLTSGIIIISSSFIGFKKIEYYVYLRNVLFPCLLVVITLLSLTIGYRLKGVLSSYAISCIVCVILGLYLLIKKCLQYPASSNSKSIFCFKEHFGFASFVFLSSISFLFLYQFNNIIIGYFESSEKVGIFNAASKIALLLLVPLDSLIVIFSPVVSDLFNKKKFERLEEIFKLVSNWTLFLTLPISIILIYFPHVILGMFGPKFIAGSEILIILSLTLVIRCLLGPVGNLLKMIGQERLEFFNSILLLIINIGLSLVLIKRFGAVGVAISMGISLIIVNLLRMIEIYKLLGFSPLSGRQIKHLAVGTISTLILLFINKMIKIANFNSELYNFLIASTGFLLSYIILSFMLSFGQEDFILINVIKAKTRKG